MRESRLLNNNWKFTYGDQVTATSEEIANWQDIGIPHSFGIPYFMEKEFYVGYGTYSTWISLSEEDCKKRLRLEFLGVFQKARVYLNGEKVGEHRGGRTYKCGSPRKKSFDCQRGQSVGCKACSACRRAPI